MGRPIPRRKLLVVCSPLVLALVLVMLLPPSMATASTVIEATLAEMVDIASYAFGGTVDSTVVCNESGRVLTRVHFSHLRWGKGAWNADTLTLRMAGGTYGDKSYGVVGAPAFESGKRYVVLSRGLGTRENSYLPIVGLWQGFFPLGWDSVAGEKVVRDHENRPLLRVDSGRIVVLGRWVFEDPGTRVSEEQFLEEVQRISRLKHQPVKG